jgi:probable O-glycosylation ligase (exosortase A-associated)
MRGLVLVIVYFSALPFIFLSGPFWGILMWYWIALMNPERAIWNSVFLAVPYSYIVAVATLLSWLLSQREPKFPPFNKTSVLLVALAFWVSITSIFGTGPPADIYFNWQLAEKMLLMTFVAYALTTTRSRLDQLILVCTLSIAFWGIKGGLFSLRTGGRFQVYGPTGTMTGDNNDLGVALTMILPMMFYLWGRYRQPFLKWPILAMIGLTFLGDIFTYSRGALVALLAMAGMLWWRSQQKLAMAALVAVAALGMWSFAPPEWFARMGTIDTFQQDTSAETRLYLWRLSWAMALKRPITGAGFHWSFDPRSVNRMLSDSGLPPLWRPRAPHSNWFQMLGDHGFVGLAIFIAILISTALDARWLVQRSRGDPDLAWANTLGRVIEASLIGYCAGGSFATQAMYDGFYAVVIIAAAARHIVAAEIATRDAAAFAKALPVARPRELRPQPVG